MQGEQPDHINDLAEALIREDLTTRYPLDVINKLRDRVLNLTVRDYAALRKLLVTKQADAQERANQASRALAFTSQQTKES